MGFLTVLFGTNVNEWHWYAYIGCHLFEARLNIETSQCYYIGALLVLPHATRRWAGPNKHQ